MEPTIVTQPRSLSSIFNWTLVIFGILGAVNAENNGETGVALLIDGVIIGLVWAGMAIGTVALWRKVRRQP